jgi:hypothetical protein
MLSGQKPADLNIFWVEISENGTLYRQGKVLLLKLSIKQRHLLNIRNGIH